MVHYDVVGAVRQEQIVQYIQHISPVHTTNGKREGAQTKVLEHLPPPPPILLYQHTVQLHA